MKIAIIGSRSFDGYDAQVRRLVEEIIGLFQPGDVFVSGGCPLGVDFWGEEAADVAGIEKLIFPADWAKYGKGAGYRRNGDIVAAADVVIAIWDGSSNGTQDSITKARRLKKALEVIRIPENLGILQES